MDTNHAVFILIFVSITSFIEVRSRFTEPSVGGILKQYGFYLYLLLGFSIVGLFLHASYFIEVPDLNNFATNEDHWWLRPLICCILGNSANRSSILNIRTTKGNQVAIGLSQLLEIFEQFIHRGLAEGFLPEKVSTTKKVVECLSENDLTVRLPRLCIAFLSELPKGAQDELTKNLLALSKSAGAETKDTKTLAALHLQRAFGSKVVLALAQHIRDSTKENLEFEKILTRVNEAEDQLQSRMNEPKP